MREVTVAARCATLIAAGRLGLGCVAIARPEFAARAWLGHQPGTGPTARVLGRALGGRDVALAVGALAAARAGRSAELRAWVGMAGLADTVDAVATVAAWRSLPGWRRRLVLGASAGAAVAGWLATTR